MISVRQRGPPSVLGETPLGTNGKTALGLAVLGFGQDTKGELYLLANPSGTLADSDYTTFT